MIRLQRLFLAALTPLCIQSQTIDDGIMMGKRDLFTGVTYSRDTWDNYWEGTLKRVNGNIGEIRTQAGMWSGNYGLTHRLNIIGVVPYVWTRPSQGVLQGQRGFQDVTLAAKYRLFEKPVTDWLTLRAIGVASGGLPLTDYTPDFQPLSLGLGSKRISGRLTFNLQSSPGWYLNGSSAYIWRKNVTLDRPYYFTEGRLFLTDVVDMPNVFDYIVSAGYLKRGLMAEFNFAEQKTQGGGDIRRQDMPFVSNRMNFSRAGGMVMVPVPKFTKLAARFTYAYTLEGRNVGQSTTLTASLMYRFRIGRGN